MGTNIHIIYIFIIIIISYYSFFLYKKNNELKNDVNTDYKTGLFNYKGAKKLFGSEMSLLNRFEEEYFLFFAMLDMDNFKKYNDKHGHIAGDLKIIELANLVKKYFSRKEDVTFRFGGDEFGMFFFTKNFNEAKTKDSIDKIKEEFLKANHAENLNLSIGSVIIEKSKIRDFDSVTNHADKNLIEVKNVNKGTHRHSKVV